MKKKTGGVRSFVQNDPEQAKSQQKFNQSQNGVTYYNCFWIRVSQGLMQSVEQCCRYLTHSLHVGEQPIDIHNLAEDQETGG